MESYVGIDAGGSGSRWAVLGAAGEWVCGDDGPPIQVTELGLSETVSRVVALLSRLAGEMPAVRAGTTVVGLAGGGDRELRRSIALGVVQACGQTVHVVGDTITGGAAALWDGPGVALFAGTGSFAMAHCADGRLIRIGGRGNRVSDHGGGYRVVLAAAEAVFLASEGVGLATELRDPICEGLRVAVPAELGTAFVERSAAEVARCFRQVVEVAEAGDVVAQQVLRRAAMSFARLARAALVRGGLAAEARVVLGGGTQEASYYREMVRDSLRELGCQGRIEKLVTPPARGAALLARALRRAEAPLSGWVHG